MLTFQHSFFILPHLSRAKLLLFHILISSFFFFSFPLQTTERARERPGSCSGTKQERRWLGTGRHSRKCGVELDDGGSSRDAGQRDRRQRITGLGAATVWQWRRRGKHGLNRACGIGDGENGSSCDLGSMVNTGTAEAGDDAAESWARGGASMVAVVLQLQ